MLSFVLVVHHRYSFLFDLRSMDDGFDNVFFFNI